MQFFDNVINSVKGVLNLNYETVIGVDTDREVIHIYSMRKGKKNSISHVMTGYKAKPYSPEFYDKFGAILAQYRQDNPKKPIKSASVVLSDSVVLTDTINLPIINKKAMDTSLTASLNNLYGNSSDLKFNRVLASQGRQLSTYAVSAMRKDLLLNVQKTCSDNQINVTNITYASSAATNAAMTLNPKLRNDSYIILDIKEESAKIIIVVKGKTMGFYTLPFGHKILYKTRVAPEDLLFDHSSAELVVLNAKEKAKAKALTMADEEINTEASTESQTIVVEDDEDWEIEPPPKPKTEDDEDDEIDEELIEEENDLDLVSKNRKKAPRKLPKFMLRPTPTNREGFMYENFRVFMKWTLEIIASNHNIISLDVPSAVFVNMPEEYNFLYDVINLEVEDNGLPFLPLFPTAQKDIIKKNLELYGGFYTKQLNRFNNFHATQLDSIKSRASEKRKAKKKAEAPSAKDVLNKILETIKKIATYDLSGKK